MRTLVLNPPVSGTEIIVQVCEQCGGFGNYRRQPGALLAFGASQQNSGAQWGPSRNDLSRPSTFGDDRRGEVRCAAGAPAGIPGSRETLTAFVLEADFSALLRKVAPEAISRQLDFLRDILTLQKQAADFPLKVNQMGRYALNMGAFGKGRSKSARSPTSSASYFEWAFTEKRPTLFNGGMRLP